LEFGIWLYIPWLSWRIHCDCSCEKGIYLLWWKRRVFFFFFQEAVWEWGRIILWRSVPPWFYIQIFSYVLAIPPMCHPSVKWFSYFCDYKEKQIKCKCLWFDMKWHHLNLISPSFSVKRIYDQVHLENRTWLLKNKNKVLLPWFFCLKGNHLYFYMHI